MINFLIEHWVSLLFGLLSAGIIGYFRVLYKKFQKLQKIQETQQQEAISELIEEKLKTLKVELQKELLESEKKLKEEIKGLDQKDHKYEQYFSAIRESWRYRYSSLCQGCLEKGYVTPEQYMQLNEMWAVYHGIDGNGQGEAFHKKLETLPVREDKKIKGS